MVYNFEFIMQDDKIRRRILSCVKPTKSFFSYQNLNLVYGVCDRQKDIFLTMTSYMSQAIMRDGRDVDDYCYIVLMPFHSFFASCSRKLYSDEMGKICVPVADIAHVEMARQAINTYEDRSIYSQFEQKAEQSFSESLYSMKEREIKKLEQSLNNK